MKVTRISLIAAMAALTILGTGVAAGAASKAHKSKAPTTSYTVKLGEATVSGHKEKVLTDAQGRTLYILTGSTAAKLECTGACAKIWPPLLLAKGRPVVAKGLTGVSVAVTKDGRMVLFRGHPLFLYSRDTKAGEATGQSFKKAPGQVWEVATTALKAVK